MQGRRHKPRFRMVLPVNISGTDTTGKVFQQLAYTLDISIGGARLAGITVALNCGDVVALRYKQRKANFRIAWTNRDQVGVRQVEGEKFMWVDLPDEEFTDAMPEAAARAAVAARPGSTDPEPAEIEAAPLDDHAEPVVATDVSPEQAALQKRNDELAAALENCLVSLHRLNDSVNAAGMPAAVAREFHAAAAHLRNTGWAVQRWVELQQDSREKDHILASVNSERVRFATRLCGELLQGQRHLSTGVSQENREALAATVQSLARELELDLRPLSRPSEPPPRPDPVALLAGLNQEIRCSTLSSPETLQLIAERARSFTGADGAAIALRDEEEMLCYASAGVAPLVGVRFAISGGAVGEVIANQRSVICRDAQKDEPVDSVLCHSMNLRSSAITPIMTRNSVMGVLQLFAGSRDAFDEGSVSLLQHLAAFIVSLEPSLRLELDLH